MPTRQDVTMASRTVPVSGPLELRATLRPLGGRFADDGWWLTARTPVGPGTLHIHRDEAGLHGMSWGPGGAWLLERMGAIAGLDDDPTSFHTDHPVVARAFRDHPGLRFGRTGLVFDALVAAICAQKVTGEEAAMATAGLRRSFSEPAPGPRPDLRLPPDPVRMAAAPYWAFHQAQIEKRRADLLVRVASMAARVDALRDESPERVAGLLKAIPGVGEWTVAKTIEVSHGDPDQVAVGDFHFKNIVAHHLTGADRGTDEEMVRLLEPFRPHRGRVVRLLVGLGPAPAFGPRLAPRDFRDS
jgi:3-methyladenine DNA glycosylase/8-oxoguanine DNA glycosylase